MVEYAGLDLGATKIRAVIATADRTILGEDRRPTPTTGMGIDVTDAVVESLKAACGDAGVDPERLEAVGVGSFGPLDLAKGSVINPANLPESVAEIPLSGPIESLVGEGKVRLQNDTVAGVRGERAHGEHHPDDMVYLTLSSGIGAGVCVDGRVLSGWDGNAGEVGHLTLDPAGTMTCGCGCPGHWEAYCSGENIPRYARHLREAEGYDTGVDLDVLTAEGVFAAAEEGDPLAGAVLDRIAHWNTLGVANVVNAYAPLVVVVGGAVAINNQDVVLDPIRENLADHVVANVPKVRLTELGEAVVVMGALASVTPGGQTTETVGDD